MLLVSHFKHTFLPSPILGPTSWQGVATYNGGLGAEPPVGVQGAEPRWGSRARSLLKLMAFWYWSTHFPAVLELVVVADLTEATRQRRTFDTAASLSVND